MRWKRTVATLFLAFLFSVSQGNAADSTLATADNGGAAPRRMQAQLLPDHEISLYLNIGYSNPYSPTGFSDYWASGFSGGAGIGFGLSRIFSVILDVNYNSFPLNQNFFAVSHDTASGGNISDTLLMANGKIRFIAEDNPVVPYGMLGLGVAFYHADPVTFSGPDTFASLAANMANLDTTNFAYRIGFGMDIRLSPKSALFLEGCYIGTSTGQAGFGYGMAHGGLKFNL